MLNKVSVFSLRSFDDFELLTRELKKESIDVIVTGGKSGADRLVQEFALAHEITTQVFLPDYHQYGRSANYHRNLEMIRNSTKVLLFWNHRSRSPLNYLAFIKSRKVSFRTVIY